MIIDILLLDGFETLDAFGPAEIFGHAEGFGLNYVSMDGGMVRSAQGADILTARAADMQHNDMLLVPGGMGTRTLVDNKSFIEYVRVRAEAMKVCASVCTGAVFLAAAGLLDNRKATTNKRAFDWVASYGADVKWVRRARWVVDGKFYTSSGVTAGMDMALGLVADVYGEAEANRIAKRIEYIWNSDKSKDDFSI